MLAQDRGRALYCRHEDRILKTVTTGSREETLALGELIGRSAPGGAVIALRGGLGAGKTTLVKGIAKGLGIHEEVTSPTYTIVSEYSGRLTLRHIDAYRLSGESDFAEIGGEEMLEAPGSLCLVEWSERLPTIVNERTAIIEILMMEGDIRSLTLSGDWLEALLP
ncbi:MAG: tRNA (adenosine(37)-N6)-threonylcarbamoyltransferase complex ATPase subunit type 1 TsaE [Rectinemataceae bacterium]